MKWVIWTDSLIKILADDPHQYKSVDHLEFPTDSFSKYKKEGTPEQNKAFAYFMVGAASMGYASAVKVITTICDFGSK